jgi:hypothetical protein
VPCGVVTRTLPLVASRGTVVVIRELETTYLTRFSRRAGLIARTLNVGGCGPVVTVLDASPASRLTPDLLAC